MPGAASPRDRYADAESLANDLERFLNHQPLLKAGNPSRRERVGNYWMRQRPKLARTGIAAVVVLALGLAVRGPLHDFMTPSYLSLPNFKAAVAEVAKGELAPAAGLLRNVVDKYPGACLAKTYLAITLEIDPKAEDEADKHMREALATLGAEKAIVDWGMTHPELCPLLVEFAEARMIRADKLAERYDLDEPGADKARDRELRTPSYRLASELLTVAVKLDPESPTIQRLVAKIECVFGEYEKSLDRVTRVIEILSKDKQTPMVTRVYCHKLRARAAILGVEHMLEQGADSSEAHGRR